MKFMVPNEKRPKEKVPPSGRYWAEIVRVASDNWGGLLVVWRFEEGGVEYNLAQEMSHEMFGDMLIDLELTGEIETSDLPGRRAFIDVRTYGGRKSAQITGYAA